jgi:hypothetical protein
MDHNISRSHLAVRPFGRANQSFFFALTCSLMFSSRPDDPDQQDRANEAGNQVADPSPENDPEVTQNGARG